MSKKLPFTSPPTHVFVGSTNPVKISAVAAALKETWPEILVVGLAVASGVAAQPMSDEATKQGADQRAKAVLTLGLSQISSTRSRVTALGVGLEGGVFQPAQSPKELWSTVWVSVATQVDGSSQGEIFRANGARFKIPDPIAQAILAGQEMGDVVGGLTQNPNLKREGGMIGLITTGFVDRTIEYTALAKLALGLWFGRDWQQTLV